MKDLIEEAYSSIYQNLLEMPTVKGDVEPDNMPDPDAQGMKLYSITKAVQDLPEEEQSAKVKEIFREIASQIITELNADFEGTYKEFRDVIARIIRRSINIVIDNDPEADDKPKADDKYASRAIQKYLRDAGVIKDEKSPDGPPAAPGNAQVEVQNPAPQGVQRATRRLRRDVEQQLDLEPVNQTQELFKVDNYYLANDEFRAASIEAPGYGQREILAVFNSISEDEPEQGLEIINNAMLRHGIRAENDENKRKKIIHILNLLLQNNAVEKHEAPDDAGGGEIDIDPDDYNDVDPDDILRRQYGGYGGTGDRGTAGFMDPWD